MTEGQLGWGELTWLVMFHPFKLFKALKAGRVSTGRLIGVLVGSLVGSIVVAVLAAIVLRVFWLEAFYVPSGSMFPSVDVGDRLFVSKSTYGTFTKSLPRRGDVVVFEYPEPDPDADKPYYVERVIALAGDELSFDNGVPIINGWRVPSCKLGRASATVGYDTESYDVFVEFLEGRAYLVALQTSQSGGQQGPYQVKPGEFWVVGDNRNNSADSRFWNGGRGGGVPVDNLSGRARWLWFPDARRGIDLAATPVLPQAFESLAPELQRCLDLAPALADATPPPPK